MLVRVFRVLPYVTLTDKLSDRRLYTCPGKQPLQTLVRGLDARVATDRARMKSSDQLRLERLICA